jgi:Zn-dependent protease with chaperone function
MVEGGAESIVHGLVAACVVGLLLRLRRDDPPGLRLGFLLVGATLPMLTAFAFRALAPGRLEPAFRDGPALFSASHFTVLRPAGVPLLPALLTLLALAGTLLFLRDLLPFLWDASRWRARLQPLADAGAIARAVEQAAAGLGIVPPRVSLYAGQRPVLLCRGLLHPRIVASTGILDVLTPDELSAAVAHEVAHAAQRDPLLGWGLMLVRGLAFFNPAVQLLARAAVHETERRADLTAAGLLGDVAPLVSSLHKISGTNRNGRFARLAHQAHRRALTGRSRALQASADVAVPAGRWHLVATVAGLSALLYLVVM